jgi:hypothetical protein
VLNYVRTNNKVCFANQFLQVQFFEKCAYSLNGIVACGIVTTFSGRFYPYQLISIVYEALQKMPLGRNDLNNAPRVGDIYSYKNLGLVIDWFFGKNACGDGVGQ